MSGHTLFGRIARRLGVSGRPRQLGLVLGGGAVRGAAHLGVLSVLERHGIRPAVVAGTSAGAIVGAGIAAGISSGVMLEAFGRASWRHFAVPKWRSHVGLLDTYPLSDLIERVTDAETFADLELPLAVVACDVLTGRRVVMSEGALRQAVIASSAIPGVFEPVRRGDALLVDGGLVDNLPVDAAIALGADYVLAVDIMPPLDGSFEPKDVRDVLMLSLNIVEQRAEPSRDEADLLITPDVATVPISDFGRFAEAYEAGVAAAEEAMPKLLAGLRMGER